MDYRLIQNEDAPDAWHSPERVAQRHAFAKEHEHEERLTAEFRKTCATERVMSQYACVMESLDALHGTGFSGSNPVAASILTHAAVLAELTADDRVLMADHMGTLRVELADIGIALREG